ncbi:hypothetical protein Lalb_Chr15g0079941 [Lupinus albus]|uniref:Uncharacterized protein n=1 Tax=Lupinus albus TaxID=3870 RepID=A0A6A4P8L2_LUPAL|nr:hypothetical protein Lalb_Chr15g0079941 [Lupinus albus]
MSIVSRRNCFGCRHSNRLQIILVHSTLVDQGSEISNLLMSEHYFQLGLQTRFKFRAFGSSVHFQLRVGTKPGQFFEFSVIFPYRHISLFQLQELHFLLLLQISRKIFLKEFLLEGNPCNHSPLRFHLPPSKFPPIFSLLHQHIRSIRHLLNITTTHGSEYAFQILNPFVRRIRSEPTLEMAWILLAKLIQPTVLGWPRWN